MKTFAIITDGGGDLTKEQRQQFDVEGALPCSVIYPDGHEVVGDIDWETITPDEYYTLMTDKKNKFKSSVPAIGIIKEKMQSLAKEGKDIIAITISSKMSGGYSAFMTTANEVMEEYPDCKIKVVDSLRYSGAISLLCVTASICRKEGMGVEETFAYLEQQKLRLHQCGILDDLFFLYRSGRVSKTAAVMGTMIGIKPMADFDNETGLSKVIGKARGYKKFFRVFPQYIKETIGNYSGKVFVITHSLREKQALEMKKIVEETFSPSYVLLMPLGQPTGVNVGPGLCATFYFGDEDVSAGCIKESQVLEKLLNA